MVVFINMEKPLVFKIIVDGKLQKFEFESLPTVCFSCGSFGHIQEGCQVAGPRSINGETIPSPSGGRSEKKKLDEPSEAYGPWMIVERNQGEIYRGREHKTTVVEEAITRVTFQKGEFFKERGRAHRIGGNKGLLGGTEQGNNGGLGQDISAENGVPSGSTLTENVGPSLGNLGQPILSGKRVSRRPRLIGNGKPILGEHMGHTQQRKNGLGNMQARPTKSSA
ncbi:hypothetical protein Gorai_013098 [Gossypium raimondii]|uniref:CCHC-type domain-containing protein n=1 Tax=Gossypium raimondii TaxID=29730 RepID=A0A7J8Q3Z7_GOSRA|nr:hypothetical protein [Gossypium raimondii]